MLVWLRAIRKQKNLTQIEIAEKVGIAQPTYCNIENEERTPGIDTAKRIAAALGFDWKRFFEDESEHTAV